MTDKFYIPDQTAQPYTGAIPSLYLFHRVPAYSLKQGDLMLDRGAVYVVTGTRPIKPNKLRIGAVPVAGGRVVEFVTMWGQGVEVCQS